MSPPKRFVAAQLSGGLEILNKRLGDKKKAYHQKHVPGTQTDEDGKFQPCYPVPLLAGRYKFLQVVGQGQSAVLISAEDSFHPEKRPVAVKIMNLDYSQLGAQEADCLRELNRADVLRVSRTVQLFNTFSFDGHYCLVLELFRPRPLHQYFQKCLFDNEEAKFKVIRKIALQLVQVLGYLKRENVIHADLKPENILIEEGEEIKIKVVDFGNAIRCVHREVSLYYDKFELQTLAYRAPEVMFGVPFGHEIDMWSLGCIVAELYRGKPFFLGQTKHEVLQKVTSVLGPFPRNLFQFGKFFEEFTQFVGPSQDSNQLISVTNVLKKLENCRYYAFASFIVGLLHYNPRGRLTPCQAAMHPFVAPEFSFCYLLPQKEDMASGYTNTLLTPAQYISKPAIQEEVKRQHFSGIELLKNGTTSVHEEDKGQTKAIGTNFWSLDKEGNLAGANKDFDTTSVSEYSTYILEGPQKTTDTALVYSKRRYSCSVEKERKSIPQTTIDTIHGESRNNMNKLANAVGTKMPKVQHISWTNDCIAFPGSEMESSSFDDTSSQGFCSKSDSSVVVDDSKESNPSKLDVTCQGSAVSVTAGTRVQSTARVATEGQLCSRRDTSYHAARTRVYYGKSETIKQEHDDLFPETKRSNLRDPENQKHSQCVETAALNKKKIWLNPLEQNRQTTGCSKEYEDDVVMLL